MTNKTRYLEFSIKLFERQLIIKILKLNHKKSEIKSTYKSKLEN